MSKTALITGISGQDGAYLARLLLEKGYRVVGAQRRSSSSNLPRLQYLKIERDVELTGCDLLEYSNVLRMIDKVRPDEVYNLAGQSNVGVSFEQPIFTVEANALGTVRLLEAIRAANRGIRFYQASTSEMFGNSGTDVQAETTAFCPRSPYGIAKLMAHQFVVNYRDAYSMFCASGILFNHESPLRSREFVSRRITHGLAEVRHQRREHLALGNLDAERDWGFAGDYVEGMWLMLQHDRPDDFVLATGIATSVRALVEMAAPQFDFEIEWTGRDSETRGIDRKSGRCVVTVDPKLYRPAEVDRLLGSPAKANAQLRWQRKVDIGGLVAMMAVADDRWVRDGFVPF